MFSYKGLDTVTSIVITDTRLREETSRPPKECMEEMKLFVTGDMLNISAEAETNRQNISAEAEKSTSLVILKIMRL